MQDTRSGENRAHRSQQHSDRSTRTSPSRLRELFELGAELAGELVALLAVVPVLLPLVHILGVLLLGSPLCAVEGRRADDGQDARSR